MSNEGGEPAGTHGDVVSWRLKRAEDRMDQQEKQMREMREESEKRERQRLRWGIGALGSALIAILTFAAPHVDWRTVFK